MNALRIASNFIKMAYDFSSVQLQIPEENAKEILAWNYSNIPDSILTGNGREQDIHVTIKYGIHLYDFTQIRNIFINERPIVIVLGKISLFNSDDSDVIKIEVQSRDLLRLNKNISKNFEVTDTHPSYNPHITLAYVKKGFGNNYNGCNYFEGKKIKSKEILFSGKDNRRTVFNLNGQ